MNDFDWILVICFITLEIHQWFMNRRNRAWFEAIELHQKITDLDLIEHRKELNDLERHINTRG